MRMTPPPRPRGLRRQITITTEGTVKNNNRLFIEDLRDNLETLLDNESISRDEFTQFPEELDEATTQNCDPGLIAGINTRISQIVNPLSPTCRDLNLKSEDRDDDPDQDDFFTPTGLSCK